MNNMFCIKIKSGDSRGRLAQRETVRFVISRLRFKWELEFDTRARIFSDGINSQYVSDLESSKYAAITKPTKCWK